ncbi:MAG: hypothetical protein OXB95_05440 [Rhodobacteraceae bacterium]|nr:hypothetical protein [Paracoccaceae bacterium]
MTKNLTRSSTGPQVWNWLGIPAFALLAGLALAGVFAIYYLNRGSIHAGGDTPTVIEASGPLWRRPDEPGGIVAIFPEMSVNEILAGEGVSELSDSKAVRYAPAPYKLPDTVLSPRQFASLHPDLGGIDDANAESMTGEEIINEFFAGLRDGSSELGNLAIGGRMEGKQLAAENVPAGSVAAQLGSFKESAIAASEMRRALANYPLLLHGRDWFIERVERSTGIQYRLRVLGFVEFVHARELCDRIVAGGNDCIPVETGQ